MLQANPNNPIQFQHITKETPLTSQADAPLSIIPRSSGTHGYPRRISISSSCRARGMATYKMRSALGGICPWNPLCLSSVPPPASVHRGQESLPLSITIVTTTVVSQGHTRRQGFSTVPLPSNNQNGALSNRHLQDSLIPTFARAHHISCGLVRLK